jgi:pimeloyl-ACP methyl ester carboxylesterase
MKPWLRGLLIALGVLLVVLLVGPFLVPVPPLEGTVPPEQLADPDSRFIEVNGITVHYKMAGSGRPALVLLHGFAASTFSWREVIGPMSEWGTVVAFDRPGFGLTERPLQWTGRSPYSPEAQPDLTVALMDALGIERAVLVGNSAGGTVALLTALTYPERVEALVLVDPAVYVRGMTPAWLRPFLNTPQMRHLGPLLARQIREWGVDFARSAWHDPEKLTPEIWEGYARPLRAENWDRALWEVTRASHPLDLEKRLGEVRVPVLVITGDDDRIVPTQQSVRLAGEIPGAQLVVIPECGHVPQEECPGPFLEAVEAFLRGR